MSGASLRLLAELWVDTTTPAACMELTMFTGIPDFERSMIVERISAVRMSTRARCVCFGRRTTLGAEQITHASRLIGGKANRWLTLWIDRH
ncbi:MAG TPA: hypothetical protein PK677_14620 [Acidiphilium sp.]|nr:hypothetical protein [Acidiphilium sp.]